MNCTQCGSPIPQGAPNCPTCGAALPSTGNAPVPPPAYTTANQAPEIQPNPAVPAQPLQDGVAGAVPVPPPGVEQGVAQQPIQQPIQQQPVVEQPVQQEAQPIAEQPVVEQSASQPVVQQPIVEQPTVEQQAQQPAAPQEQTTAAEIEATPPADSQVQVPEPAPANTPTQATPVYEAPVQETPEVAAYQAAPAAFVDGGNDQNVPPQTAPMYSDQPAPKKNTKRNRIIAIVAAAVVVIAIAVIGVNAVMEGQRSEAYANAMAQFDEGNYAEAYDGFYELGGYQDSSQYADYCSGEMLIDEGDYADAYDTFTELGDFNDAPERAKVCTAGVAFLDASALTDEGKYEEAMAKYKEFSGVSEVNGTTAARTWYKKTSYGLGDVAFQQGKFYTAYGYFDGLGDYEDAPARAAACVQPVPANGEHYHNEAFVSSSTDLTFDGASSSANYYVKVYSGDTLVSTLFVHAGASATTQVPPGDYTFKSATGSMWFGGEDMFGKKGDYEVMLFDGSNQVVHLDGNMIYTVTLYAVSGGNVGNKTVNPDNF